MSEEKEEQQKQPPAGAKQNAEGNPAPKKPLTPEQQALLRKKKEKLIAAKREKLLAQAAQNKTVVAPRPEKTEIRQPKSKSAPADRTVVAKPNQTVVRPRAVANPEATQFKKPEPQAATTQFAKPLTPSAAKRSSSDDEPAEKTVFKAPPGVVDDPDKTDISLPMGSPPADAGLPDKRELLKNRFILEDVLGAGGMGVVYKAKDLLKVEAQDRDPYVAIKVLGEEFKSHPEAFIALQRESRKTQSIAHPNIVNVHDFDKDGHTVFMTMEFLEGTPLDKLIKKYRSTGLPELDAWQILEGICAALSYAHNQNIIHSDLKPGNIFVTNANVAKVFDFGIARAVASAEQSEAAAAEDRTVFDAGSLGALTPAYASLEMLEGETPDIRDDIYALGCIAYELFTGRHPYNKKNAKDAQEEGLRPERIENITKRQWKIIESSLAFSREDRVPTVDEFWTELKKIHTIPIKTWIASILVVLSVGGYTFYEYTKPEPVREGPNSEEIRNEIEFALRLERIEKDLKDLLSDTLFDARWELSLWEEFQNLSNLLGAEDPKVLALADQIFQLYVAKIEESLVAEQLEVALGLANNALRYSSDKTVMDEKIADIQAKIAERDAAREKAEALAKVQQEKQQAAQQVAKAKAAQQASQRNAFNLAMGNVNEQLTCKRMVDMNDFGIAIDKMKNLSRSRYNKEEPRIIRELASCIKQLSRNFPHRAAEAKRDALNIFNNNKLLAAIEFESLDACNTNLAGLGARGRRGTCDDVLSGGGKGPSLVVVPAASGFAAFAIGKYEVTQGELDTFCLASGTCAPKGSDPAMPATQVSLRTAEQYTSWLTDQTGKPYRLPTAKEWMYAATSSRASLDSNRNCLLNSRGIQKGGQALSTKIGQQNKWGLINHVGNVREWVVGSGATAMGGSFNTPMEACTLDLAVQVPASGDSETGFRVLRELTDE